MHTVVSTYCCTSTYTDGVLFYVEEKRLHVVPCLIRIKAPNWTYDMPHFIYIFEREREREKGQDHSCLCISCEREDHWCGVYGISCAITRDPAPYWLVQVSTMKASSLQPHQTRARNKAARDQSTQKAFSICTGRIHFFALAGPEHVSETPIPHMTN